MRELRETIEVMVPAEEEVLLWEFQMQEPRGYSGYGHDGQWTSPRRYFMVCLEEENRDRQWVSFHTDKSGALYQIIRLHVSSGQLSLPFDLLRRTVRRLRDQDTVRLSGRGHFRHDGLAHYIYETQCHQRYRIARAELEALVETP